MKKIVLMLLLLCSASVAQTVRWSPAVDQEMDSTASGAVYFSFRGVGIFGSALSGDTSVVDPPDEVYYDGTLTIAVQQMVDSTSSDSMVAKVKGIDAAGTVIQMDSAFVFGSSMAAPGAPNVYGDGRLHVKTITSLPKHINGVVIEYIMHDTDAAVRRWRWKIGTL